MHPFKNPKDLDPLIEDMGNRKAALPGEASHGSKNITQREKKFPKDYTAQGAKQ